MAYEPHARCTTPPDDTVVRRFVDLSKLLDLLENRELHFARVDRLEDPREGRLTAVEQGRIREVNKNPDDLLRSFENSRLDSYVSCWCAGDFESMAMWKLFGNGGITVALGSTIGALKETLAQAEGPVFISETRYLNLAQRSSSEDNLIGMMVRKSRAYLHESEVRLLIWAPLWTTANDSVEPEHRSASAGDSAVDLENVANEMANALMAISPRLDRSRDQCRRICVEAIIRSQLRATLRGKPTAIRVPIQLEPLIKEVIVGPEVPRWIFDLVRSLLPRYGLQVPTRWSELRFEEEPK